MSMTSHIRKQWAVKGAWAVTQKRYLHCDIAHLQERWEIQHHKLNSGLPCSSQESSTHKHVISNHSHMSYLIQLLSLFYPLCPWFLKTNISLLYVYSIPLPKGTPRENAPCSGGLHGAISRWDGRIEDATGFSWLAAAIVQSVAQHPGESTWLKHIWVQLEGRLDLKLWMNVLSKSSPLPSSNPVP